jgi:hypothetical protein
MKSINIVCLTLLCFGLAVVHGDSPYQYNVKVYLSSEHFNSVQGDLQIGLVSGKQVEKFVSKEK